MQPFKQILGNFLERYKQLSMVRAIGDQVEKNPEGKYSLEFIVNGDSSKIYGALLYQKVKLMN